MLTCDNPRNDKHVTLKVFAQSEDTKGELWAYDALRRGDQSHEGRPHVRAALNAFKVERRRKWFSWLRRKDVDNDAKAHQCLVQKPMWDSWSDFLRRNPDGVFDEELLKMLLVQLFLGIDYLHSACKLVHTGQTLSFSNSYLWVLTGQP